MPRLSDKIAEQAAAAERVRENAEKKDVKTFKIIKKKSPKN